MATNTVSQTLNLKLVFTDQNGNPMLTQPTPDAPPVWSNTNAAAETLTPSADGLSCADAGIAEGADTLNVSAAVGGKTFAATLAVTVNPAPQVLTGVEITVVP